MKKRLVSLLLVLLLAFTLVPSAFADTSDCGLAGCTCSGYCSYAYYNYRPNDEDTHFCGVYCTGCGIGGGVVMAEEHTFNSRGECIYCGYEDVPRPGGFYRQKRRFLQVKSRRKHPKNAPIA